MLQSDGGAFKRDRRSGNVLFLILIAVALFAALSYAVTRSSRDGGTKPDKEKVDLVIAEIDAYAVSLRQAFMRVKLSNGCADSDISAANAAWPVGWVYGGAATGNKCALFDTQLGGGAVWQAPPAALKSIDSNFYAITPRIQIDGVGSNDGGLGDMALFTKVTRDICLRANRKYGIDNPSGEPPVSSNANGFGFSDSGWPGFSGPHTVWSDIGRGGNADQIFGHAEGCFKYSTGEYVYYQVVLPH